MIFTVTIPRPKGPTKYVGDHDKGYGLQLQYLCNTIHCAFRQECDLIVVGSDAYDLLMRNEDFSKISHMLTAQIIKDSELPPLGGYACIKSRAKETAKPLVFRPHPYIDRFPFD